jgi:uncharacterized integral membrane protein (TIGR00698 family)
MTEDKPSNTLNKWFFILLFALSFVPWVTPPMALAAGIVFSFTLGNPFILKSSAWSKSLLQLSVIGLGFGIGLGEVLQAGKGAIGYTLVGIAITMLAGRLLGRLFSVSPGTSTLVSFGTAICGGSAIAAMAPVVGAKDEETAVSLATVFALNSVALLLFPVIGHLLHLDQLQFGLWAALAIHDTSSVVGAASAYGAAALSIAVTVKLARALWIAPCALGTAWFRKEHGKTKLPLFILGFIAAASLRSLLPALLPVWTATAAVAKQSLVATLFLIGTGLTQGVLRRVGVRPLAQGVALWVIVSGATLGAIMLGWIRL